MPGTGAVPHPGHHLARLQQLPLTEVPPAGGLVLVVQGIDTIIQIFGIFWESCHKFKEIPWRVIKICIFIRNKFLIKKTNVTRRSMQISSYELHMTKIIIFNPILAQSYICSRKIILSKVSSRSHNLLSHSNSLTWYPGL